MNPAIILLRLSCRMNTMRVSAPRSKSHLPLGPARFGRPEGGQGFQRGGCTLTAHARTGGGKLVHRACHAAFLVSQATTCQGLAAVLV